MPRNSEPFITPLEALLRQELMLQKRSLELLGLEREAVRDFRGEDLALVSQARELLFEEIGRLAQKRSAILAEIPEGPSTRISELVRRHASPSDAARIGPLIVELKKVVQTIQRESRQQSQVVEFARSLVHGTLSIIWSATQNVTRAYTRLGGMKESYAPTTSRKQTVLKEA